jgi:hypothetical protein
MGFLRKGDGAIITAAEEREDALAPRLVRSSRSGSSRRVVGAVRCSARAPKPQGVNRTTIAKRSRASSVSGMIGAARIVAAFSMSKTVSASTSPASKPSRPRCPPAAVDRCIAKWSARSTGRRYHPGEQNSPIRPRPGSAAKRIVCGFSFALVWRGASEMVDPRLWRLIASSFVCLAQGGRYLHSCFV